MWPFQFGTQCTELSWTHYRIISRIEEQELRLQYITAAINAGWDTRSLQRNINTKYLGRTVAPQTSEINKIFKHQ